MCLLQTVLLTFVALFLLQLAYLLSVNKVNLGGFELFGLFGQVKGGGELKLNVNAYPTCLYIHAEEVNYPSSE